MSVLAKACTRPSVLRDTYRIDGPFRHHPPQKTLLTPHPFPSCRRRRQSRGRIQDLLQAHPDDLMVQICQIYEIRTLNIFKFEVHMAIKIFRTTMHCLGWWPLLPSDFIFLYVFIFASQICDRANAAIAPCCDVLTVVGGLRYMMSAFHFSVQVVIAEEGRVMLLLRHPLYSLPQTRQRSSPGLDGREGLV